MSSPSPETDNRIAAVFGSKSAAESLASELVKSADVSEQRINVIAPKDHEFNRKLEGSSQKIGKRMLKDHIIWGIGGLTFGAVVAGILVSFGPELTRQNPVFTFIALISPGIFSGLFISGLLSLRPDHDMTNEQVRSAAQKGEWTVVVSLDDSDSKESILNKIRSAQPVKII
ncbi:hypothetical protein [Alteromonas oceanisediminis]|uniref:hypothetical protein n=1 Tax=Alteromonas oceanisediminis TaxID=2836180 RepID=UPI001BDACF46|nr:hypothetical protein [Alteromonas oceanisediminis]MBT0586686.1 hypothetical protein [Alteromonas oceanisediminis]